MVFVMNVNQCLVFSTCLFAVVTHSSAGLFHPNLFSSGMILQRGTGTRVWGENAMAVVTVHVSTGISATSAAPANGTWMVEFPEVVANESTKLTATDGVATDILDDVAWGDVILCGGQSNMGFGMCGATVISTGPNPQTPSEALAALPKNNPIRFYNQQGDHNGGAGSTVKGNVCKEPCTTSNNGFMKWFKAAANNSGSASAVCLLTAQRLRASLGGNIPVGAVESCVGGTNVEPWTPPSGSLYVAHITPLLPMRFMAALWDQGEADAKRTNTTYYSTEFPKMIEGWRAAFQTPTLPFVYVELCHEDGASEPKEKDFWQFGQRAALKLPAVGFATTTDIDKSALHPPDKQDISIRLDLEIRRLALGENVVARGPELVSTSYADNQLIIVLSNSSMVVHKGVVVPPPAGGCDSQTLSPAVTQASSDTAPAVPIPFVIKGNSIVVKCKAGTETTPVLINGDNSNCFLYSSDSELPAPPLSLPCSA